MKNYILLFAATAGAALAQGPQSLVVPAAHASSDAVSFEWVPGASQDVHQQTLVGPSHLGSIVGHQITGLSFRRTAANETYLGGTANMTVWLSTSPLPPLECSAVYAANVGQDVTQVYQGMVSIPTSPAVVGVAVPWTPSNVIQIVFAQPFVYLGGTLCIDIVGLTVSGQTTDWWMADAAYDYAIGTAVDIGPGCGSHANALGQWSWVSPHTLLPGSTAGMSANGPEGNWAVAVVGPAGPAFPLPLLNLGQPGCNAYLSDILFLNVTAFWPTGEPLIQARGGVATYGLQIPNANWVLGAQMTTQWLDLVAQNSSNAVTWTVATAAPTLDMALFDGVASDTTGNVSVYLAHVLRLEYQ
jgi:hypothetical protein